VSRESSKARREDAAHDVLAAEAFAVPGPDPELRHGPVVLPDDPSGIAEPHDILAAEEFAMPAARPVATPRRGLRPSTKMGRRLTVAAAAGGLLTVLRLRRRGR
jgi:hypothetical protein